MQSLTSALLINLPSVSLFYSLSVGDEPKGRLCRRLVLPELHSGLVPYVS